jgi:hypothetical protein
MEPEAVPNTALLEGAWTRGTTAMFRLVDQVGGQQWEYSTDGPE